MKKGHVVHNTAPYPYLFGSNNCGKTNVSLPHEFHLFHYIFHLVYLVCVSAPQPVYSIIIPIAMS